MLDVLENYKEYEEKYDKEFVGGHLELQFVEGEVQWKVTSVGIVT